MFAKLIAWFKSLFANPVSISVQAPAPVVLPTISTPNVVSAPRYGTIIPSMTAAYAYRQSIPVDLVDPVYWVEQGKWYTKADVADVRAFPHNEVAPSGNVDSGTSILDGQAVVVSTPGLRVFPFTATKEQYVLDIQ